MKLKITDLSKVTPEKVDFVEAQANKMLTFVLQSRELLVKEAHTTLQWLFAITVGAAGYVVRLVEVWDAKSSKWWIVGPLATVAAVGTIAAISLFRTALRTFAVPSMGNEPRFLATDEMMAHDEHIIRLVEAGQLQERIENALAHNRRVGRAINQARWVVVLVPIAALYEMFLWWKCAP